MKTAPSACSWRSETWVNSRSWRSTGYIHVHMSVLVVNGVESLKMIAHERHLLNEPLNAVESEKSDVRWQNKSLNVAHSAARTRYTRLWLIIAESYRSMTSLSSSSPDDDLCLWWSKFQRCSRLKWKVLIVKNVSDDEKWHRTLIYFDLWNWDLNEAGWAGVCGNVSVFWQLRLVYKRKRIGSYAHNLSATLPANKSFKKLLTSDLKSFSVSL